MARRGKTSPAEDLVELAAMLPWWVGVVLAPVGYLLLHGFASHPIVAVASPGQMGVVITQSLWKSAASVGQYALPVICLAGAGISAARRKKRKDLVIDVVQSKAANVLDGMSWREFEMLVGEGFRLQGYQVLESGGGGADGGVDLVLSKPGRNGGEKWLVQCKQWRALKVGVDVVRELYGVMAARGATGGFVVTFGRFTEEAISFASGRNVMLVDGPKLVRLIGEAQATHEQTGALAPATKGSSSDASSLTMPACPLCSKPMTRRAARRGGNAGNEFWGCTAYPACRGTRSMV